MAADIVDRCHFGHFDLQTYCVTLIGGLFSDETLVKPQKQNKIQTTQTKIEALFKHLSIQISFNP